MDGEQANAIQGKRRAKGKCEICLILINPFPFHQRPQFPINNRKFTFKSFETGRSKMLWYAVTFEGNKKINFVFSMVTSITSLKSTVISHPFTKLRSRSNEVERNFP